MSLQSITKELEKEYQRLEAEIEELEAQDPSKSGFRDMNNTEDDDAGESEDHSRIQALLEANRDQLGRVKKALTKIGNGSYGTCERCSKPIAEARLKAMPWAIYDVECEEVIESGRR